MKSFHESASNLLVEKLSKFKNKDLNKETCISIYTTIFESLQQVFEESGSGISNEALNWIAQEYYDAVKINQNNDLDPNIFTQRAKIDQIETKELALMAMMFKGTPFAVPLVSTIKKRS
jgi:hypothetical protein